MIVTALPVSVQSWRGQADLGTEDRRVTGEGADLLGTVERHRGAAVAGQLRPGEPGDLVVGVRAVGVGGGHVVDVGGGVDGVGTEPVGVGLAGDEQHQPRLERWGRCRRGRLRRPGRGRHHGEPVGDRDQVGHRARHLDHIRAPQAGGRGRDRVGHRGAGHRGPGQGDLAHARPDRQSGGGGERGRRPGGAGVGDRTGNAREPGSQSDRGGQGRGHHSLQPTSSLITGGPLRHPPPVCRTTGARATPAGVASPTARRRVNVGCTAGDGPVTAGPVTGRGARGRPGSRARAHR